MGENLTIIIAETAGFCFGVKRAVNLANRAPERYPDQPIRTLGPIIHNPQVVEQLAARGVIKTDDIAELGPGVVIIRSHGITRQLAARLEKIPGLTIINATCPFVRRAQEIVARMSERGYEVIIIGEPDHPEVAGLISYGEPERTRVITTAKEIPERFFQQKKPARIALLAQTTQPQELYNEIAGALLPIKGELRCFNTICTATSDRQSEVLELAGRCDCMLIIGGRNSANTNRLHQLSLTRQPRSHHIETARDLRPEWFAGVDTVGISAGASTPQWLIDETVTALQKLASRS
jgi:4-hydroxy-3-methylbut-2-enyl diphosphate reductase